MSALLILWLSIKLILRGWCSFFCCCSFTYFWLIESNRPFLMVDCVFHDLIMFNISFNIIICDKHTRINAHRYNDGHVSNFAFFVYNVIIFVQYKSFSIRGSCETKKKTNLFHDRSFWCHNLWIKLSNIAGPVKWINDFIWLCSFHGIRKNVVKSF